MLQTYEMRWFFDSVPLDASRHFETHTELQVRTDWYASPCSALWGVKLREGRLETKVLDGRHGTVKLNALCGHLESYKKWSLQFPEGDRPATNDLRHAQWLAVSKRRSLRRFAVDGERVTPIEVRPTNGCEFEMTKLQVNDKIYWTVGFEAVGEVSRLADNLRQVAHFVATQGGLLQPFDAHRSFGYAQWLATSHLNQTAADR